MLFCENPRRELTPLLLRENQRRALFRKHLHQLFVLQYFRLVEWTLSHQFLFLVVVVLTVVRIFAESSPKTFDQRLRDVVELVSVTFEPAVSLSGCTLICIEICISRIMAAHHKQDEDMDVLYDHYERGS